MRLLLLISLLLTSFSSFAGLNCRVEAFLDQNGSYKRTLALYNNIDLSVPSTVMTLVKSDGTVLANFRMDELFRDLFDNRSLEDVASSVKGDKLVSVSVKDDVIELYIGQLSMGTKLTDYNASIARVDFSSKKFELRSLKNDLSVVCTQ